MVKGGIIVLPFQDSSEEDLAEVKKQLSLRETGTDNNPCIKDNLEMFGRRVVYSDFTPQFKVPDPTKLAEAAINSGAECLKKGCPFKNGIRYLRENIEWGVNTELTVHYEQAILEATSSKCLDEAENKELLKVCASKPSPNP